MSKGTSIIGFILSFIAGAILMWGIDRQSGPKDGAHADSHGTTAQGEKAPSDGKASGMAVRGAGPANPGAVKVEFFVMSQCPYGVEVENGFKDAYNLLGKDVDFQVNFIGKNQNGVLTSMHGQPEVMGDTVQLCAMKHSDKWYEAMLCQNKAMKQVDTNFEACAAQVGIDPAVTAKVTSCAAGEEGKALLAESFQKAADRGATGSPTIYINNQPYNGGRKGSDFMKAVCNAYSGAKPAACSNIPESPKVNVTILTDKRCAECNTARFENVLKKRIDNPVISTVDYSDPAGKKLFDEVKPDGLPVVLFDKTLDADANASQTFGQQAVAAGDWKVLKVGGEWNPVCAEAANCSLDECKNAFTCREEIPNKMDLFIMSQCPYGVAAINNLKEVVENFKKNNAKFDLNIHYIGNGDASNLSSMHGQGEVVGDIQGVCAVKHAKDDMKFMDFLLCRNKDIKNNDSWPSCAGSEMGIDADKMKACIDGEEGKKLLAESFAFTSSLKVNSSPTWIVNNKFKVSAGDPESIKTQFCAHNKVDGCDTKLTGPAPRPGGGAAAAQPGCG